MSIFDIFGKVLRGNDNLYQNSDIIYSDEDEEDEDYDENDEERLELYQIDTTDAYYNGAFDEDGDEAICSCCGGELRFRDDYWECLDCGATMDRLEYLNYIGAEPPFEECLTCGDNYPLCRKWCHNID